MERVNKPIPNLSGRSKRRFDAEAKRQAEVDARFLEIQARRLLSEACGGGSEEASNTGPTAIEGQQGSEEVLHWKKEAIDAATMDRHERNSANGVRVYNHNKSANWRTGRFRPFSADDPSSYNRRDRYRLHGSRLRRG